MGYQHIRGQLSMALDGRRNQFYLNSLKSIITKDSVVLDLGAGLGILGLLAAQCGAKKVYCVEPASVISMVPKLFKANGFEDKLVCIKGKIEDVKLPEKVDIILSVFTGNFLLSENLLPSLFFARDKYLKKGGRLIPDSAEMVAAPIESKKLFKRAVNKVNEPHLGLDFSSIQQRLLNESLKVHRNIKEDEFISSSIHFNKIDFYTATNASCNQQLSFIINQQSTCHGFLGWFDMFSEGEAYSTSPFEEPTHWSPLYYPVEEPISFDKGDELQIKVQKPVRAPWSWKFSSKHGSQQMSGFKSRIDFQMYTMFTEA